jgi:hypothetical protein
VTSPSDLDFAAGHDAAFKEAAGVQATDLEIARSIGSFFVDRPDSPYQHGYLAGLKELFVQMQAREPRGTG